MRKTLAERFWAQVTKADEGACWEWAGHKGRGYGYISVGSKEAGDRKELRAHRVSWQLVNGPIPSGMVVMHICDNRGCVNPSHLRIGSQSENIKDAFRKGRKKPPVFRGNAAHGLRPKQTPEERRLAKRAAWEKWRQSEKGIAYLKRKKQA